MMRNILIALLVTTFLVPVIANAVQVSVPSSSGSGFMLVSTSTGAYIATTTNPLHAGSFFATTTSASQFPYATSTGWTTTNFWITGQSSGCAQFDSNAKLTSTGVNCGTGAGGSDSFTHTSVYGQTTSATSTLISLTGSPFSLVASSTVWFDQMNVGSTTVGGMSTSTFYGNVEIKGHLRDDSVTSALVFDDVNGNLVPYAGTSCSNQFPTAMNAAGSWTCGSVTDSFFSGQLGTAHGGTGKDFSASTGVIVDYAGTMAATASSTLFGTGVGGQQLVWANGIPSWIATTTYSGTAPIALSFSAGAVTGSCTNASSGVTGCLTGTDWNTFNGKQATLSFSAPLILNGTTVSWYGISTSTALTGGQVLYATDANHATSIATSSATCTSASGISCTGFNILGTGGTTFALSGIPNTSLSNSSFSLLYTGISGESSVALGGTLHLNASTTPAFTYFVATSSAATSTIYGMLQIGSAANNGFLWGTSTLLQMSTSTNNFAQAVIQNTSAGGNASADYVVNNDKGTNAAYFAEFGIDSSGYNNQLFSAENPGDAFMTSNDSALVIGSATTSLFGQIRFVTAGTASSSIRMVITEPGSVGIATSTPGSLLSISGFANFFSGATSTIYGALQMNGAQFAENIASSTDPTQNVVVNWNKGNTQRIIASTTLNITMNSTSSNPIDGAKYVLKFCQDGTGGHPITFTSIAIRWGSGTTTVSSAANTCTMMGGIYDATYGIYNVLASSTGMRIN